MASGFGEEQALHAMCIDDAYRVERVLARGAGGVTELVTIDSSGPYLRKRIPISQVNRKAWAALAESSCPRLPQVIATYEAPDEYVVVCSFVPGDTFAQLVAAQGRFAVDAAVRAVREVCEAVSDLHAHGAVHCDISPENIVIAADGAHLIDFGIARLLGQLSENDVTRLGTWGFAAPEQFGFAQVDERTDVFALACLLGYALTGLRPDDASYEASLADEQAISKVLCGIVKQGSAFEPSMRYPTAVALNEAVTAAIDGAQVGGGTQAYENGSKVKVGDGRHIGAVRGKRRRPAVIVACIVGGLLCVACIAFGLQWYGSLGVSAQLFSGLLDAQRESAREEGTALQADDIESVVQDAPFESKDGTGMQEDSVASENGMAAYDVLSIVESNWHVEASGYVSYVFGLRNESSDLMVVTPAVKIVGRDESGRVISSDEQYLCSIQPGQTLYFAGIAGNTANPHAVDFVVKEPRVQNVHQAKKGWASFRVMDVSEVPNGYGGSNFVGEVALDTGDYSAISSGSIAVTVVLRDDEGKAVFGTVAYTDGPKPGVPVMFEVRAEKVPAYAHAEVYVQEW